MPAKRYSICLSLIRCGSTEWDDAGRLRGSTDLPLSANGRAAIGSLLEHWSDPPPGPIFHAPDEAAVETASLIARHFKARVKAEPDLADADLGLLEGLTASAFAERYRSRSRQWQSELLSLNPPEGEPIVEARARLFRTVARLLHRAKTGEVSVVVHDIGLGLLRCWLAGRPASDTWSMLDNRPLVERYEWNDELIERLEVVGETEPA